MLALVPGLLYAGIFGWTLTSFLVVRVIRSSLMGAMPVVLKLFTLLNTIIFSEYLRKNYRRLSAYTLAFLTWMETMQA